MRQLTVLLFWLAYLAHSSSLPAAANATDVQRLLQQARASAEKIQDVDQRFGALRNVALAYGEAGESKTAAAILAQCLELAKRVTDPIIRDHDIVSVIMAQAKLGDFDTALQTAQHIENEMNQAWARYEIVAGALSVGEIKRATEIADTITEQFNKDNSFTDIAVAEAEQGKIDAALQTVKKIQDKKGAARNAMMFIVLALSESGRFDDAQRVLKLMENLPVKIRILLDISKDQLNAGNRTAASVTFKQALDLADATPGHQFAGHLAVGHARMGNFETAVALAKTLDAGVERDRVVKEIAVLQAGMGNIAEAVKLLDLIGEDVEKDQGLEQIAIIQAKTGNAEDALRTLQSVKGPYFRSKGLREVARILFKKGDRDHAKMCFQLALEAANLVDIGGGTKVIAFHEVARAQAETGDSDAAGKTFRKALQNAETYADLPSRAAIIEDVARAQAASSQSEQAAEWALKLPSPLVRCYALLGVVRGILDSKK